MNHTTHQASIPEDNSSWLKSLGTELAFIQDAAGFYRAFYWDGAGEWKLDCDEVVGTSVSDRFTPLNVTPYLERIARVLNASIPERFSYPFRLGDRTFVFELIVTPLIKSRGEATEVLVMGRLLPNVVGAIEEQAHPPSNNSPVPPSQLDLHQKLLDTIVGSIRRTLPPGSELYQKLLGEMARKIRRSLDLKTIWEETVQGIGSALGVDRCILCPYQVGHQKVSVVAEYRRAPLPSMRGRELWLSDRPDLRQALEMRSPVTQDATQLPDSAPAARLVVATCYQDRPNGLICLERSASAARNADEVGGENKIGFRSWSDAEIELVRELAEQVGTAIAHATLYTELEKARKQAEEVSRLKSQFLANTSHELRTPLNGTIGFLKLIMDDMAESEQEVKDFVREAYQSAVHLLNLINDILDIAKIEAGKMQLELAPVKLDELFAIVKNHTRAQIRQKHLSFQIQLPPTEDEIVVFGNYQRLLQVMLNLVGNAIKFTHEGGITISAEILDKKVLVQERELPAMVNVSVADTGIGVSLEKQDKLFQSFSQVDGERTRQYGGTGLGLAISQKLVQAMGGMVNFYSMGEGLGSTVTFTVPLYQKPVMVSTARNP
ncbi:GAF domain-containing sensor histidine kinase [Phormidium sp. CCY1219]|uniref:GAF domain-containing sensor histidine kinase n=1 Tax=Phormidium sp. CCY1219 TaxID=2886104 RepID=UPI002D1F5932|nr:ATP-binding protein [Phormidium sp. CCY1219]MEB3826670.1 GAF domain-containing protein [Phormidium sp. CCY1219]